MYRDIKNHIKLIIVINKPKKIKMNVANRKTGDWLAQFGFFFVCSLRHTGGFVKMKMCGQNKNECG